MGGFNALLMHGGVKHWDYGDTTMADWIVWDK